MSATRRHFVTGLVSGTVASTSLAPAPVTAIEPFRRPTTTQFKWSLAAYSLREELQLHAKQPPALTLPGFLDYAASLNLDGVELTSYYFPTEVTDTYLMNLKRQAHLLGLGISGGAIRNDFCQPLGPKYDADLQHTKRWIDYYAKLGAPVIRVFAGNAPPNEPLADVIARCARGLQAACTYAGQFGILLALENHGGVTARAQEMLQIVRAVDSPWFGVNFDSGNFQSTDDPYTELAQIAPFAVNAQLKIEMKMAGKVVPADYPRLLEILRTAGYRGWLVLEYEAANPRVEIPKHLQQLRNI